MIKFVVGRPNQAEELARFIQPIYAATYPNDKYGLTKHDLRLEVFLSPDTLKYTQKTLTTTATRWCWLAYDNDQLVGCINIERETNWYEIHAFYVALDRQGQGIGRRLLRQALTIYDDSLPIRVEVAETNELAQAMYRHWGFIDALEHADKWRHWPEWPDGVNNRYIYMQVSPSAARQLKLQLESKL